MWFGVATYLAWSPLTTINKLLPAGSMVRGVILTLIPLVGVLSVSRLPRKERTSTIDLLVALLAILVLWEGISVELTTGTNELLHVVPSVALLALAASARGPVNRMSMSDISTAVVGVLAPLDSLLILGWIAQYLHLEPPSTMLSTLHFSVNGYRLQGLGSTPNGWGFLAALVTLVAFVGAPGKLSWATRAVGVLTLFASDSRTSIIALGVGLFLLWVLGPGRDLGRRVMAVVFLVVASVGIWGIIDVRRQASTDVLSDRDLIWRNLLPYLHHLPLFGYGPNIFVQLAPGILGPGTPYGTVLDAQNQWLSDSLEFGFVAAAILTITLLAIPLHGSATYRHALSLPLLAMVLVKCFSEVPLAVFFSIDGAFPLFLLIMWAPLRERHRIKETRILRTVPSGSNEGMGLEMQRTDSGQVDEVIPEGVSNT
jgi:hypothetical protein